MYLRDVFGCVVWLATSIYVGYLSLGMGFGTFRAPGAGFFPFWAAVMMGTFSVIHLAGVHAKKGNAKPADSSKGMEWKKTLWVILFLLLYPLFLPILGYLITTFILMGFLLFILGKSRGFWVKIMGALAITSISYFLFDVLLDIVLPKGVFGF